MKFWNLFMTLFLGTALNLSATSVLAKEAGGADGGGGDTRCIEFYQYASKISVELVKMGQAKVSKVNPLIDVMKLREIVKSLKVLPVHNLDRQARSNPDTLITSLDVDQYPDPGLEFERRLRLVTHELLVLAKIEGDGEFAISEDLHALIRTTRVDLPAKCQAFTTNSDGTTTIQYPYFVSGRNYSWIAAPKVIKIRLNAPDGEDETRVDPDKQADGICKHLGFSKAVRSDSQVLLEREIKNGSTDARYDRAAFLDYEGHLKNIYSISEASLISIYSTPNYYITKTITCTDYK